MAHEPVPQAVADVSPSLPANGDGTPLARPLTPPRRRGSRGLLWLGTGVAGLGLIAAAVFFLYGPASARNGSGVLAGAARASSEGDGAGVIPVNTVRPRKKTLERTLEKPGTIKPWARVELYAKVSGYLRTICRAPTPGMGADLVAQGMSPVGSPLAFAARLAAAGQVAFARSPEKDIGSAVAAGEMLVEVETPERFQDIVEKESLLRQRQAELEAARAGLATFEAAAQAVAAQKVQAEADVRKCTAEHAFRTKELNRLKELVQSKTVTREVAEEKENQALAALAAWDSSRAKVQAVQADYEVASSKFAAARADLKVKEALVQVARDALRQAHIQADYSRVYAPFDGVITSRGVDEGDFVQNATSGQARRLLTVTAMDQVKVVLHVPEKDVLWVGVGSEATITVDARTGRKVEARVSRVAGALEPETRTMQVEIDLDNRDRQFLPDMYGYVTLVLQRVVDARAIPATAVYSRKGENYILQVENGVVRRRKVRLCFDDGKEVEVVKLAEGREIPLDGSEELVVSNKGELADGQKVKTALLAAN